MFVRTLGNLSLMSSVFLGDVLLFREIGRVDVVILHKPAVQEKLLVHDLTPLVHGLEVLGRVGVVLAPCRGFPGLGSGQDDRMVVGGEVDEGGSLAGLGRITLSHV